MASVKTKGIVLKGTNFGEADRILTIFTERYGKIKAIAKGVRKIKSHLAGSLEPFMLVDLQLHEGKTFYIVTGAVIIDEYLALHNDLSKVAKAFFLGELVDKFLEEKQKSLEIFELFLNSLSEVDDGLPGALIQAFQLKLIEFSGFQPELFVCTDCKEKISSGGNYWNSESGGVVCDNCGKNSQLKFVSDEVIKLFRFIEENSTHQIVKLKIQQTVEEEAEGLLNDYIYSVLERELKSQKFLKQIKG